MAYITGSSDNTLIENARDHYLQWKAERERLTALGMLLDAQWFEKFGVFVKIIRRTYPNGLATHFELFYNELGEEVPRPKGYKSA